MTEQSAPTRAWRPAPLLYVSGAVHLGAAAALALRPQSWPWAVGALVANHAALSIAGLWPRSPWLGPNLTSLPVGAARQVALTIDDGPDPRVTPQALAMLEAHGARATFFCIGDKVERYAELAQEIVRRGHALENHSQRHRHNFSLLGPGGMQREIAHAQESILRITGTSPRFFRAPAGLRNPFLDPVLARLRLRLASWTRRGFDTVNADPQRVYARLTHHLASGDILLLHDGNAARDGADTPVILNVLPRLLETLRRVGLETVTLRAALP
jgi:peptidoglycan-N-acetylglucosamine deacetylase